MKIDKLRKKGERNCNVVYEFLTPVPDLLRSKFSPSVRFLDVRHCLVCNIVVSKVRSFIQSPFIPWPGYVNSHLNMPAINFFFILRYFQRNVSQRGECMLYFMLFCITVMPLCICHEIPVHCIIYMNYTLQFFLSSISF